MSITNQSINQSDSTTREMFLTFAHVHLHARSVLTLFFFGALYFFFHYHSILYQVTGVRDSATHFRPKGLE